MKQTTRVNFTTITGKTGRARKTPADDLEARAERWINDKIEEGWSLRDIFPAGPDRVHVVMVRKVQV